MLVQISDILKEPGRVKTITYRGPLEIESLELSDDVEINFKLTNAGSRVLVDGSIKTSVLLCCSRCTETFSHPLEVSVSEQFLPNDSPELDDDKMDWDNLSMFPIIDDGIDLQEVFRQNLISAVPTKPLCRRDCPGIPYVADDTGEESAPAEENDYDPRLLPLLQIQRKAEGKNGSVKN